MNILILARKNLATCDRVVRVAKEAEQLGHRVTVISLGNPQPALKAKTPSVHYIEAPAFKSMLYQSESGINIFNSIRFIFAATLLTTFCFIYSLLSLPLKITKKKPSKPPLSFTVRSWFKSLVNSIVLFFGHFTFAHQVEKLMQGTAVECCIAHDSFSLIAADKIRKSKQAKLFCDVVEVTWSQTGQALKYQPSFIKWIEKKLYTPIFQRAHFIMCTSPSEKQWIKDTYHVGEVSLIRNCREFIEPKGTSTIKHDLGLTDKDKLAIYSGSLHKNLYFEKAIIALKYTPDNVHLAFMGECSDGTIDFLKLVAARENVSARCHFIGAKASDEFITYMSGADIGFIPLQCYPLNTFYSLPNKVFEMIMARLPIAASRVQDIKALVSEYEIGRIFNEEEPQDIARVIVEMVQEIPLDNFNVNLKAAAKALCWQNERATLVQAFSNIK